jgi:hypothetical protein
MTTIHTGGCLCGNIRYEIATEAPPEPLVCHCTKCRGASGAPLVAWVGVARSALCMTRGEPRWYRSSDHARRGFCGDCGSQLFFESTKWPDMMDITTITLDDPAAFPPAGHIWTSEQLPWMKLDDGLPRYAKERDG